MTHLSSLIDNVPRNHIDFEHINSLMEHWLLVTRNKWGCPISQMTKGTLLFCEKLEHKTKLQEKVKALFTAIDEAELPPPLPQYKL